MPATPRRKPRRKKPIPAKPRKPTRGGPGVTPTRPVVPIVVGPVAPVAPVAPVGPIAPGPPVVPATPVAPDLPADPRARAKFLIDRVRARRADIDKSFFDMGVDLRALSKPLLYRHAGYNKFEDLLKDQGLPTRVQAWKLISIVDNFDEPTARAKGIQWCYAVLKYAAAKAGGNVRGLIARNPVIPGPRLRLLDARASQIEDALRHQGPGFTAELKHAAKIEAARLARSYRRKGARSARARTVAGKTTWLIRIELTAEDVRRLLG